MKKNSIVLKTHQMQAQVHQPLPSTTQNSTLEEKNNHQTTTNHSKTATNHQTTTNHPKTTTINQKSRLESQKKPSWT